MEDVESPPILDIQSSMKTVLSIINNTEDLSPLDYGPLFKNHLIISNIPNTGFLWQSTSKPVPYSIALSVNANECNVSSYISHMLWAFRRIFHQREVPSPSCLRYLSGLLTAPQLSALEERHPNLRLLLEKKGSQRTVRAPLCREALLVSQKKDDSLENRKRARLRLKAYRLRQLQKFLKFQASYAAKFGLQNNVLKDDSLLPLLHARFPLSSVAPDPDNHGHPAPAVKQFCIKCQIDAARQKSLFLVDSALRLKVTQLLAPLPQHAREMRRRWREGRELKSRISAEAARTVEAVTARREAIRERERKQRMRLLKENDFDSYVELIRASKNSRIEELLAQTENFLRSVTDRVRLQQRATQRALEQRANLYSLGAPGPGVPTQEGEGQSDLSSALHTAQPVIPVTQPKCLIGGELLPYQLQGLQFLVQLFNCDLSGILADEMGLGKTIQTIALLAYLKEARHLYGPHLIIVPLSTLPNWAAEFERWCPTIKILQYRGGKDERKKGLRDILTAARRGRHNHRLGSLPFDVCLTTYDWIIRDKQILSSPFWSFIIVDEGHRMKNINSKFHLILSTFNSTHRLLLTGTPLQNNLSELWALLNFLLPEIFTSAADFETWFQEPFKEDTSNRTSQPGGGGSSGETMISEEESFLIINRLHQILRPFLLRRVKEDVLKDLPEKKEYTVRILLSQWQQSAYKIISNKVRTALGTGSGALSFSNIMMQLRKIVNHPYLFENEYLINDDLYRVSGKFEILDRILSKLICFKHKILIFCQMTQLMDILDDYLELKQIKRCRLDGSTSLEERKRRMEEFNDENSDIYLFVLSTRAGGLGLNLQAADTVILFDSDWNPHQDLQAQARAYRMGQRNEVRVLRFVTNSNIEDTVLSKAQHKLTIDEKIIKAGMFDQRVGSSEEERKEKLRKLLYNKEMINFNKITTPQELNKFLARTPAEEEMFKNYDKKLFGLQIYNQLLNLEGKKKKSRTPDSQTTSTNTLIEECFIKANRLLSEEEVPQSWIYDETAEQSSLQNTFTPLNTKRQRGDDLNVRLSIEAESLTEAAFNRAVRAVETGEVANFEEALALERSRKRPSRSTTINNTTESSVRESPGKRKRTRSDT